EGIRIINKENRDIDKPTDVLSFPMLDYNEPADFSLAEDNTYDYFDAETGNLLLGDIVISLDKVYSQAEEYGHSPKREIAFLTAHSMLHLFGYDHMEEEERKVMEELQEEILTQKGYSRDYE
ncbi:MAG: rRNA maturation RNase YbeY, partial [Eubacterium sp.]|nr:rRNA maturation RNase YbeY [Eubacterium sp.]